MTFFNSKKVVVKTVAALIYFIEVDVVGQKKNNKKINFWQKKRKTY